MDAVGNTRIIDLGFAPGRLPKGARNKITDVPGVLVGHHTVLDATHRTGVTVILPRPDVYLHKCVAAAEVINGYGKTAGLVQVRELGQLETPIALTNTLNVGLVCDALVQYTLDETRRAGVKIRSINPLVGECNDGTMSNIADRVVGWPEVADAIQNAAADFAEGCVGGGTGMICHELKGGIGSASRVITLGGKDYTVGVLVQANHGQLVNLTICGQRVGPALHEKLNRIAREREEGSCILVLATDLPVSARQLGRIVKRCGVGLARCGSFWGHGSGDIAIGFTTAHDLPDHSDTAARSLEVLDENHIDPALEAAAEASEEAVLNALAAAETMTGVDGRTWYALKDVL